MDPILAPPLDNTNRAGLDGHTQVEGLTLLPLVHEEDGCAEETPRSTQELRGREIASTPHFVRLLIRSRTSCAEIDQGLRVGYIRMKIL